MRSSKFKLLVVVLFILSGICGLIYEVVWSKYLSLFIGSSGYSHMIVLATYMGGLALGAFVFGKYSDHYLNQLKLYGLLEMGIGLYCLLYPFLFGLAGNTFVNIAIAQQPASTQSGLLLLKFFLSLVTLLIPTFLMGGTLPVLTKFVTKTISDSGKEVAILYYINSFGAVIGTALGGFYLVRHLGMENTMKYTAIINIIIGLLALAFSRIVKKTIPFNKANIESETAKPFSTSAIRMATLTALVSGLVAMLYELSWIRLLSNILGSTTYSFSIMLVAFISGIAIGSFIVSLVIKKIKNLLGFLAFCQLGTAVSMVFMLPLYERLPYFLLKISAQIPNTADHFSTFLELEFLFCFLIMLIPTIFSGMSLPVASRIVNSDMKLLGKSIGGIFSINTIGSVVGALITGLVLLPHLGIKITIETGLLINGIFGVFLMFKARVHKRIISSISALFIVVGYMVLFPNWNQNFLISGVFRTLYTQELPNYDTFKAQQNEGNNILWYKEGIDANVAVRESVYGDTIQRSLVINGKADASTVADLPTQVLLGQLPLMLQPNTGDVLVIGLGSGITCGSALRHPIRSLDVVEISKEVVACNSFFANDNYHFMLDVRAKIFIDDAITKLKISPKKYDHIISEPSNPWIAGIGNLYSLEFFESCKSRMNKNGVLTQWFHTYDVDNAIFNLVLSTISKVFPHVSIWKASNADLLILASAAPMSVDFDAMTQKMKNPKIANDLARIKMYDIPALLSTQVVSPRNNPYVYQNAQKLNSTNDAPLEYLAPVALFTHADVTVLDSLDERFTFMDKRLWISAYQKKQPLVFENYMNIARYRSGSNVGDLTIAYSALRKALEMEPENKEAQSKLMQTSQYLQLPDWKSQMKQLHQLRIVAEINPTNKDAVFTYLNALIEYYRIVNSIVNPQLMNDAVELLKRSIEKFPSNKAQFQYILGMVLTGAGRSHEAAEAFVDLLHFQRSTSATSSIVSEKELLQMIGESYYNARNTVEAEVYFKYVQFIDPENSKASMMMNKMQFEF